MIKNFTTILIAVVLILISSCNKSGGTGEEFGIPDVPIGTGTTGANVRILTIIGGDNQIGAPGVALSDTFRVAVTENGNPISNAAVSFSVVSGTGGSFSSSLVTTDNAGMAQTTFTPQAGYIGAYSIRASHLTSSALFAVNVEDPAGMDINIFNGDNQTDVVASTLTNPLRVQVLNHSDSTPAVGVTVSFDVVAGNGRINGTSNSVDAITNAAGIAYVNFKLGTLAGVNSIRASLASSPTVFQTFTATGTVSASLFSLSQTSISASPTSLLANGVALTTLTLTARDVYGNQLTSGGGTVVFTPLLGTLLGTVTDHSNGTYTQQLRAPSSTASAPIIVTASYNGSPLTS
jgi:adhesin/invasin